MTVLLQYFLYSDSEQFENRSIVDEIKAYEVEAYKRVCPFHSGHPVVIASERHAGAVHGTVILHD